MMLNRTCLGLSMLCIIFCAGCRKEDNIGLLRGNLEDARHALEDLEPTVDLDTKIAAEKKLAEATQLLIEAAERRDRPFLVKKSRRLTKRMD